MWTTVLLGYLQHPTAGLHGAEESALEAEGEDDHTTRTCHSGTILHVENRPSYVHSEECVT